MKMNTLSAAGVALAMAMIAIPTAAAASPTSAEVSYGDLDLTSNEGIAQFDSRIGSAVFQVCGGALPKALDDAAVIRACRIETLNDTAEARQTAIEDAQNGRRGRVKIVKLTVRRPLQFQ